MNAKQSLDRILAITRVHFYKPIQIAEILYRNRLQPFDLSDLSNYRTTSKRWRDEISFRIVGNVSTSSSRFQDNLFEENALAPSKIAELGKINNANNGIVEAYIYVTMQKRFNSVFRIFEFLNNSTPSDFKLSDLYSLFSNDAGLHRSMDKVFEISSYALFDVILDVMNASVTLSIDSNNSKILSDFDKFVVNVLGIESGNNSRSTSARVYRVGATNANDGGLDMWANYGPAIQIKHIGLNAGNVVNIVGSVTSDAKLIIICKDSEANVIDTLIKQIGIEHHVQSIITYSDINEWYNLSFSEEYKDSIGTKILEKIRFEFSNEFPANYELPAFIEERGYNDIELSGEWNVS